VTRIALFSACASLALLSACTDATTGSSSSPTSAGALGGLTTGATSTTTPTQEAKNTNLITPVVQQSFNTFSASQYLKANGVVGADVLLTELPNAIRVNVGGIISYDVPVGGTPSVSAFQAPTAYTLGIPDNGNTIKQGIITTLHSDSPVPSITSRAGIAGVLYEGSQPKGSSTDVTIDFNPRDAVYSVKAEAAPMAFTNRWQDPRHRTVFQQTLVPTLSNYRYAESGTGVIIESNSINGRSSSQTVTTLFVRDVGTSTGLTQYVTIAGFVEQKYSEKEVIRASATGQVQVGVDFSTEIKRSVLTYGINTPYKDIPKSGSASYSGDMYAHLIETPQNSGTDNDLRSIVGTSVSTVDFGTGKLSLQLAGNVVGFAGDTRAFAASGTMDIFRPDTAKKEENASQFSGAITSWSLGAYNSTAAGGIVVPTAASTIEGGFYGAKDQEIGGAFRIIGNRPDERIDILGAFAGKKGN
jgi:hypothetical protein